MSSSVIDVESLSTGGLVDAAFAIASELAARKPSDPAASCMEWAETLIRAADVQERALARLIETVDRSGEVRRWGLPSTQAWLRSRLGMRDARAKERVLLARQLPRLPEVAARLADGTLPAGYAVAVTGSVSRLDDADCTKAETVLLTMADDGYSAGKVAAFGTRIRDVIAERDGTDQAPGEAARGFERSWVASTRSLDGGRYLKGWLNAEDAAVFDGTLAPLAKPAGAEDLRDLPERTAAALVGVLSGGHRATKVTLICDLDTLTGGTTPARLPDGTPIPAAHARRIALSAGVSPLLLGPGHLPLYLGRRARFASGAQRRVLETRYPTCAARGCESRAPYVKSTTSTGGFWGTLPPTSTASPCAAASTTDSRQHTPNRSPSAPTTTDASSTGCCRRPAGTPKTRPRPGRIGPAMTTRRNRRPSAVQDRCLPHEPTTKTAARPPVAAGRPTNPQVHDAARLR